MKEYVLGFAFSADKSDVVMIEKQKPDWQKGKLNGVGGKVEDTDANIYQAMSREFKEETGLDTLPDQWQNFGYMLFENDIMGGGAKVWLFKMFDNNIYHCKTNEEENILITTVAAISGTQYYNCMHNLPILIPIALSEEFTFTELKG